MAINPNTLLLKALSNRLGHSADRLELKPRIETLGGKLHELSSEEKASVLHSWKTIGDGIVNPDYWRFYKAMGVFNPLFVPDNIYWSRIIRTLNPVSLTRTYINKSLYPIIFKGLRQPEIVVNSINGDGYDGDMNRLTATEVLHKVQTFGDDIIIKPTTASSGGSCVSKIAAGTAPEEVKRILERYGRNFICQRAVRQSESTAVFNPSSLNTFRVNTINLNGKTTVECLMMRHGLNGSVVDNFAVGGIVCGMTKDGDYNGTNFNTKLERVSQTQDGSLYQEKVIPAINKVLAAATDAHQRYMPHIGHAAWDFAIDENENPVMIEVNLMLPGIIMEQLTAGAPIFGDRTEEVINYANRRKQTLRWTEFVGGWE